MDFENVQNIHNEKLSTQIEEIKQENSRKLNENRTIRLNRRQLKYENEQANVLNIKVYYKDRENWILGHQ